MSLFLINVLDDLLKKKKTKLSIMKLYKIVHYLLFLLLAFTGFTACTDIVNSNEEQLKEVSIMMNCGGKSIKKAKPLYVVNNKVIHQDSLKSVKPKYIDTISILKGEEALNLFGDAGKHGVVKIQTDQKGFSAKKAG